MLYSIIGVWSCMALLQGCIGKNAGSPEKQMVSYIDLHFNNQQELQKYLTSRNKQKRNKMHKEGSQFKAGKWYSKKKLHLLVFIHFRST